MYEGKARQKMTEGRWKKCEDPDEMLMYLGPSADARKLRLFACACCRRVLRLLTDDRAQDAILIAEKFADGQATHDELAAARAAAKEVEAWARFYEWAAEAEADFDWTAEYCSALAAYCAASAVMVACGDAPAPYVKEQKASHHESASALGYDAQAAALASSEECGVKLKIWRGLEKIAERAERAECVWQAQMIRDIFGNPFRGP